MDLTRLIAPGLTQVSAEIETKIFSCSPNAFEAAKLFGTIRRENAIVYELIKRVNGLTQVLV